MPIENLFDSQGDLMDTIHQADITFNASVKTYEQAPHLLPLDISTSNNMEVLQVFNYKLHKHPSELQHDHPGHRSSSSGPSSSFLAGSLSLQSNSTTPCPMGGDTSYSLHSGPQVPNYTSHGMPTSWSV